jgi:hypothetical protein
MSKQTPTGEGVKDLPSVPGSLNHGKAGHKVPALGSIGEVKDRSTADSVKGGKA